MKCYRKRTLSEHYNAIFFSFCRDKKPYILVSGDDDGKGYILEPSSSRTDDWSYLSHKFVDVGKGTVGQFAFADVNADGYTDIVVPAYNDGTVSLYTFAPSMSDSATTFGWLKCIQ